MIVAIFCVDTNNSVIFFLEVVRLMNNVSKIILHKSLLLFIQSYIGHKITYYTVSLLLLLMFYFNSLFILTSILYFYIMYFYVCFVNTYEVFDMFSK